MRQISGYELILHQEEPVCCGFGGLFAFKFSPIAETMAKARLETFVNNNIETLVSNDPGCIMHMRQEVQAKKYIDTNFTSR